MPPKLNMIPVREYTLDGVTFRFVPYLTPAIERESKEAALSRQPERIVDTMTRNAWFAITEIENDGEVFTRHDISLDPTESLNWGEANVPYRVFVEISHHIDMGDYPLAHNSKMDENGDPEMTVWNFLGMTLLLSGESIGPSTTPSPEPSCGAGAPLVRATICERMKWTHQEYDCQPIDFLLDLSYLFRTQNIIRGIENSELEHFLSTLRNQGEQQ